MRRRVSARPRSAAIATSLVGFGSRAVPVLLGLAVLPFAYVLVNASIHKYYNIDEFQYAHAGWLVARGWVPYRDFFQVYMPLLYQWLSLPFIFLRDENPAGIAWQRLLMLPPIALIAASSWFINRSLLGRWALLTPLFLLSVPTFVARATEIRPEGLATSLFLAAVAVLHAKQLGYRARGAASGLLASGSLLASQKALYYCLAFLIALSVHWAFKRGSTSILGSPVAFCAAGLVPLAGFAVYLTLVQAWGPWWRETVSWSLHHQRDYPRFPVERALAPFYLENRWIFAFAAGGLALMAWHLVHKRRWPSGLDTLLVLSLASTFASFALTAAPYDYTLVPFISLLCIFAARGCVILVRVSAKSRLVVGALVGLAVTVSLARSWPRLVRVPEPTNAYQYATLLKINALTRPGEHVYDNSGSAVTRPHVLYHYYGDRLHLSLRAAMLDKVLPAALRMSGCAMVIVDRRFSLLPERARKFIIQNYQPYDADLMLPGKRFDWRPGTTLNAVFQAFQDGQYFVWPDTALAAGGLRVDGKQIASSLFSLPRGERRIEYSGRAQVFFILRLPANGERYRPRLGLPPRFSL